MSEHVRTGNGFPFGPHGDPENGERCADTECETCGCCMHCEHACDCAECGCAEWREKATTFPSVESDPVFLVAEIKRLRTQLGCIKALAVLWDEEAENIERSWQETDDTDPDYGDALTHAAVNRHLANAVRDILSDATE